MVRDFQSVIGREVRAEFKKRGRLPDAIVACVGGGSNSMGSFHAFVRDKGVRLIGVEAGGTGAGKNAASLIEGRKGVLHGMLTYVLQDENGQVRSTESISAGLDYPGVGPEHSFLKDSGRATYVTVSDDEAVEAFHLVSQKEGIIPALGVGPRGGVRREAGEADEEEPVDGGDPLRKGRQGRPDHREEGRVRALSPISAVFQKLKGEGASRRLRDGWRP